LKGEYAAFIIELELEVALLEHINECPRCSENIAQVIKTGVHLDDWWNNLFSKELPDFFGYNNDFFPEKEEYCPSFEEYANVKEFIEARILWRKKKLKNIWYDARTELGGIMTHLKDKRSHYSF
jgi:hypothetical protein